MNDRTNAMLFETIEDSTLPEDIKQFFLDGNGNELLAELTDVVKAHLDIEQIIFKHLANAVLQVQSKIGRTRVSVDYAIHTDYHGDNPSAIINIHTNGPSVGGTHLQTVMKELFHRMNFEDMNQPLNLQLLEKR